MFLFGDSIINLNMMEPTVRIKLEQISERIIHTFRMVNPTVELHSYTTQTGVQGIKISNWNYLGPFSRNYDFNCQLIPQEKVDIRFVDRCSIKFKLSYATIVSDPKQGKATVYLKFMITDLVTYEGPDPLDLHRSVVESRYDLMKDLTPLRTLIETSPGVFEDWSGKEAKIDPNSFRVCCSVYNKRDGLGLRDRVFMLKDTDNLPPGWTWTEETGSIHTKNDGDETNPEPVNYYSIDI